jgi:hypothetical protein
MNKNNKIILWILIIGTIGSFSWYFIREAVTPGKYDTLAQCIADSGAKFYGAFWCPHCQNQKKLFGKSEKLLPYVECSTPNGQGQLQVCIDAGIQGYPTWEFADGSRLNGEIPLTQLAEKTSCQLPQ